MPHSVSPEPQSDTILPAASDESQTIGAPSQEAAPKDRMDLDDMFNDDKDEEYSQRTASQQPLSIGVSAKASDPEVLKAFYQRLFPFRYLFQWLNHSVAPKNDFAHREFAFTLPNEAYLRYQSFPTADLLKKQCTTLLPTRFEIGPVYSTNPRDRKTLRNSSAFRPLSKELVFDVDMDSYDPIRTCCSGAQVCNKCWAFITMAIRVVDAALSEDFGFKHILWVYSGRRGAHAWVCDERARQMSDDKRRAIAGYLELIKGGDKSGKKVNIRRPLHPHLERSLRLLRDHFSSSILNVQDPFASDDGAQTLISLLPDAELNKALQKKWDGTTNRPSASKWADIDSLASSGASKTLDTKVLRDAKQDIVLEYTYPRLDAEVSKKLNHLLKSPFCVHPKSGRICVPIDPRDPGAFNPEEVPTVTQLLAEIDEWSSGNKESGEVGEAKKVPDWEKTSLKPYVEFFRTFVNGLLKEEGGGKRPREDGMEF